MKSQSPERIGKYLVLALGIPGLMLIFHSHIYPQQSLEEFYAGVLLGLTCVIIAVLTQGKNNEST
ncbi:MAG: hypothetical protein HC852_11235 [Acaryochloridaceae cyanobacterium RU_4_10]|nr:hypothetical protein [Acaryochloridaceae cyanobacterium RU_4_10]